MPPAPAAPQRSPLGLLVLLQLSFEPSHVYRLQKLFEHQGKDRVINVKSRASLYQAIERLVRLGLVEELETVRGNGVPDRTLYAVTDAGRAAAAEWLREMLTTTGAEFPEFITAVSVLFALEPQDARVQLETRAARLRDELADTDRQFAANPHVPRLFLLEEEYRQAVLRAELAWLQGLIDDLREGRLTWSEEWMREVVAQIGLPQDQSEESKT
jgi:DNA-binding PadR family transcriptional regulator